MGRKQSVKNAIDGIVNEWKAGERDNAIVFGNLDGNAPRNIKRVMARKYPEIPYVLNFGSSFGVFMGDKEITPAMRRM